MPRLSQRRNRSQSRSQKRSQRRSQRRSRKSRKSRRLRQRGGKKDNAHPAADPEIFTCDYCQYINKKYYPDEGLLAKYTTNLNKFPSKLGTLKHSNKKHAHTCNNGKILTLCEQCNSLESDTAADNLKILCGEV